MHHRSPDSGWVFREARAVDSVAARRGKADSPIAETAADRAAAPEAGRAGRKGEGKAADSFAAMDQDRVRATGRAARDRRAARPTATSRRAKPTAIAHRGKSTAIARRKKRPTATLPRGIPDCPATTTIDRR
jgi:hypothetical protein